MTETDEADEKRWQFLKSHCDNLPQTNPNYVPFFCTGDCHSTCKPGVLS